MVQMTLGTYHSHTIRIIWEFNIYIYKEKHKVNSSRKISASLVCSVYSVSLAELVENVDSYSLPSLEVDSAEMGQRQNTGEVWAKTVKPMSQETAAQVMILYD